MKWTLDALKKDALKYKTKSEWKKNSTGYNAAIKYNFLNECCSHMISGRNTGEKVNVFGVSYETITAAQKKHGLQSSGNYATYLIPPLSISRAVELEILKSHHTLAISENIVFDENKRKHNFLLKKEKTIVVAGEYSPIQQCSCCNQIYKRNKLFFINEFKRKHFSLSKGFCSDKCKETKRKENVAKGRKRLQILGLKQNDNIRTRHRKHGTIYTSGITARTVALRDGMKCQVCGVKVEPHKGKGWQPNGWSIGHVKAMADGGNTTWDNVQCECIKCNSFKGVKPLGQIGLFTQFAA